MPRRALLNWAGGLGLGAGLLTAADAANAPALQGAVPEVDKLIVRVVTDSNYYQFGSRGPVGEVDVGRFVTSPLPGEPRELMSEWGLALHLESHRGAQQRQILMDFGFSSAALLNNLELLQINPARLNALLLTHGHIDHFGGLPGLLDAHGRALAPDAALYIGGEACFCTREAGSPEAPVNFGTLNRQAIAASGLRLLYAERPALIADHAFSTGTIAQDSFESLFSVTRMRVGQNGAGQGCAATSASAPAGTLVPDDFAHELATCYHVKGLGLVVLNACGHRGIANTVRTAMRIAGVEHVHAIVGGFHLGPRADSYVRETLDALKALKPDYVIPMHCSGEAFSALAAREMPSQFISSYTGSSFTFGE